MNVTVPEIQLPRPNSNFKEHDWSNVLVMNKLWTSARRFINPFKSIEF